MVWYSSKRVLLLILLHNNSESCLLLSVVGKYDLIEQCVTSRPSHNHGVFPGLPGCAVGMTCTNQLKMETY